MKRLIHDHLCNVKTWCDTKVQFFHVPNVMRSVTIIVLLGMMVVGVIPVAAAPMEGYSTYNADDTTTDVIDTHRTGVSKNHIPITTYLLDIDLVNDVFEGNYTIRQIPVPEVCLRCFNGENCPVACIMYNVNQQQKMDLNDEIPTPADPDPFDSIIADIANEPSSLTKMSINELRNIAHSTTENIAHSTTER